jgi:hypothetical protein
MAHLVHILAIALGLERALVFQLVAGKQN